MNTESKADREIVDAMEKSINNAPMVIAMAIVSYDNIIEEILKDVVKTLPADIAKKSRRIPLTSLIEWAFKEGYKSARQKNQEESN